MKLTNSISANLGQDVASLLLQLQQIITAVHGEAWLVGGTIRDLLDGQSPGDFDFAFAGDLTPQVKRWAKQQGGHWFWLDKTRNQSRVLFSARRLQFDFAPLRAEGIAADLSLRDFTINAMALEFKNFPQTDLRLIDPLNGRQDLEDNILRSCGPGVLRDDPLRTLKGIRHHALRGWCVDSQTLTLMAESAARLTSIAGERLRNELGQILGGGCFSSAVELMDETTVLDNLFPGIEKNGLPQSLASLRARLDQMESISVFSAVLGQTIEAGLTRRSLLLLGELLRRLQPSSRVVEICQRLRFSVASRSVLQSLHGPLILLDVFNDSDTARIAALKLESLERNCQELMLFALARQMSDNRDLLLARVLDSYRQQVAGGRIADLLDGSEIISLTGVPAGQLIGYWQKRIKAAEIAGEISSKLSAQNWLKQQFSD